MSISRRTFMAGAAAALASSCRLPESGPERTAERPSTTEETRMILIPAGTAVVGTDRDEVMRIARQHKLHPSWLAGEQPRHTVELPTFRIDRYPVTNAEFLAFSQATNHPWWPTQKVVDDLATLGLLPATFVNVHDANAYADWAGKRLPTEEEWEYAARGPEGLTYPWGHRWDAKRCNSNDANTPGGRGLTPVDAYPDGASPFGVMDLVGNVAEWTASTYAVGTNVVKGGFWKQHEPYRFRPAFHCLSQLLTNRQDYIGFRCVQAV